MPATRTSESGRKVCWRSGEKNHRVEKSWWPAEEGGGLRERDKGAAVAGELACLAGYMAGYLKGATCAPTGSPQYHPHSHPAMGVGTHPHPHSHPHPGAPHPGLPSPFALATHGHPHPHPLDHGLGAFPQGTSLYASSISSLQRFLRITTCLGDPVPPNII